MKNKVQRDLARLYQAYAQILLRKQELETEIRIRRGMLELLESEDEQTPDSED